MRRRLLGTLTGFLVLAAVGTAGAQQQSQTDVLLAAVGGTRTLLVTTPTGTNLGGGTLDLGTAHTGAFMVSVVDANYDHVGYEVTGTLSNLYLVDGPSSVDCGIRIDSSKVSLAFPVDPQLRDLGLLVEGVVSLSGQVTAELAALLDPLGLISGLLGDTLVGEAISATDSIPAVVEEAASGLDEVLHGLSDLLPVKIGNGDAGLAFTNPASFPGCGNGGTPTQRTLMTGDASSAGAFFDGLVDDLESAVNDISAQDLIDNGIIDAAAAEAAAAEAIQGLEDDINAVLGPLGPISLPQSAGVIGEVLKTLKGALGVVNLIGQSGVGVTVPSLVADASQAPASGIFKGRMTVTLVDD